VLHSGHIHDTYFVETDASARYVLQRVNHHVFKQPDVVMDNIRQATEHLLRYFAANGLDAKVPELVAVQAGGYLHQDASGNFWRMFTYIPDTVSVEKVETPAQAFEVAQMFGRFVAALRDLPASRLPETIPGFHDAVRRRAAFADAAATGLPERRAAAAPEMAFFTARSPIADRLAGLLARGEVPLRIVHNDTKISNVLLDAATGRGVCAIDLDTVMPGTLLYDFGDMMRTFLSPAAEDETDLSQVRIRMDVFEALAQGYWAEVGGWITPAERENMLFGGQLMTYIMGIRFLTDYLQGDVYYKTHRPGQNLDRCRTQMRLLLLMEEQESEMQAFWAKIAQNA
jgi:Ser/Thr protein kinase RdoA (MazF antagonist)